MSNSYAEISHYFYLPWSLNKNNIPPLTTVRVKTKKCIVPESKMEEIAKSPGVLRKKDRSYKRDKRVGQKIRACWCKLDYKLQKINATRFVQVLIFIFSRQRLGPDRRFSDG